MMLAMARSLDLDELVEHWTLLDDEQALIAGKRGAPRLGFSLLLKLYGGLGRFLRGRSELPDEAVASSLARSGYRRLRKVTGVAGLGDLGTEVLGERLLLAIHSHLAYAGDHREAGW